MTPAQEKAKELVSKFTFFKIPESEAKFYNPKQCALICVEEIEDAHIKRYSRSRTEFDKLKDESLKQFWNEVKQEIEKI